MLEFLVHRVQVISNELNAASKRVRALTQDLDGFLHELDVLFGEAAGRSHRSGFVGSLIPGGCCVFFFIAFSFLTGGLLLAALS